MSQTVAEHEQQTSRKVHAILAGGLVLGVGASTGESRRLAGAASIPNGRPVGRDRALGALITAIHQGATSDFIATRGFDDSSSSATRSWLSKQTYASAVKMPAAIHVSRCQRIVVAGQVVSLYFSCAKPSTSTWTSLSNTIRSGVPDQ